MRRRDFWLIACGCAFDGGLDRIWPVDQIVPLGIVEIACAIAIAASLARKPPPPPSPKRIENGIG